MVETQTVLSVDDIQDGVDALMAQQEADEEFRQLMTEKKG